MRYFYLLSLLLPLIIFSNTVKAQEKPFFVQFKDKIGTPFAVGSPEEFLSARSVQRRQKQNIAIKEDDLPVSPDYTDRLRQKGAKILYTSRWFNGALLLCTDAQFSEISKLSFVASGKLLNSHRPFSHKSNDYSDDSEKSDFTAAYFRKNIFTIPHSHAEFFKETKEINFGASKTQNEMLGVKEMHEDGFRGKGKLIAVIDAGFPEHDRLWALKDAEIVDTYNFVTSENNVNTASSHGTKVFSTMAANRPNEMVGTAPEASYALYISEVSGSESPLEEIYWLFAAERADSLGVDVINTSLGYYDFDNPIYNYKITDLDGKTAFITRASEKAFERGMFLVTSAGNEGSKNWGKITFPADAPNVLAVGAVDANQSYAGFSSYGPSADGRIKPDVAAMGANAALWGTSNGVEYANGTSFAGPITCGFAAGLWQANPELTNGQLLSLIRRSGSRAQSPNELYGYGIPHYGRAQELKNVTGIDENDFLGFRIAENPTERGRVSLVIPSAYVGKALHCQIYSGLGQKLYESSFSVADIEKTIITEQVRSGLYFLRLSTDEKSTVLRFLVR
jgi:hypothetical protein